MAAACLLWFGAGCAGLGPSIPAFDSGDRQSVEVGADAHYTLDADAAVNPRDGAGYRAFEVDLAAGDAIRIDAQSDDFGPSLTLYDPDGSLVGAASVGAEARHNRLIRPVDTAGTYLIVVAAPAPGYSGAFQLTIDSVDAPSPSLSFPGDASGISYGSASPDAAAEASTHHLAIEEAAVAELTVEAREFTPRISVVDVDTGDVYAEAAGDDQQIARVTAQLPAGDYELRIARPTTGPDGYYQVQATTADRDEPRDFRVGTDFNGLLPRDLAPLPHSGLSGQMVTFSIDEAAVFDARIDSDAFAPVLVLTDGTDTLVTEVDSDPLQQSDARLIRPLEAGDYALWITSYSAEPQGLFELETELRDPPPTERLQPDAVVNGALTEGAALHPERYTFVEYYTIEVDDETHLNIELESREFDAYLVVEDSDGEVIARNDDAHIGTTDAGIETTFQPGTYRIGVTTFAPDTLGAFTLTVERTIH